MAPRAMATSADRPWFIRKDGARPCLHAHGPYVAGPEAVKLNHIKIGDKSPAAAVTAGADVPAAA